VFLLTTERIAMYQVEVLERTRLVKGLSYSALADELGLNVMTIARTLRGATRKPRTVKLLADYLGVDMATIVK
jgi:transcriptional regulator with XRE-family HTH domain